MDTETINSWLVLSIGNFLTVLGPYRYVAFVIEFIMSTFSQHSIPFILHVILESPAAVAFALFPSATLRTPQPEAHALIRQYALSLLTTVLIAAVFARQPHDLQANNAHIQRLEQQVAGALALYHVGPMIRAARKYRARQEQDRRMMPCLHFFSHGACGMALAGRACQAW